MFHVVLLLFFRSDASVPLGPPKSCGCLSDEHLISKRFPVPSQNSTLHTMTRLLYPAHQ